VAAAGIEKDRIGISLVRRILIRRVNVIDDDVARRPALAVGIAAVVGLAIDNPAAGLVRDVLRRVRADCDQQDPELVPIPPAASA
jgi:hypothetical protein